MICVVPLSKGVCVNNYISVCHANMCGITKCAVYLNIKYIVMTSLKKDASLELNYVM
jgi:hypothetical protein